MDTNFDNSERFRVNTIGIPYDEIFWNDIEGQPFGIAKNFNAIVFNDANNIVDISGAFAVGGNFYSPRGLSLAFGNGSTLMDTGYNPYDVRFLAGGSVTTNGPLVVVGHVVGNGPFYLAKGSTYLIGKSGDPNQLEELKYLYQRSDGSKYWTPSEKGDHFIIPSYDVPRYIPASRIGANVTQFFRDARNSINAYKECIDDLEVNGTVVNNNHELILRGNDPVQNVFEIDVRPSGLLNKGLRQEVPENSIVIIKLLTGDHAHLQYGLYGSQSRATRTLYVFEDAKHIHMEVPADFWGSILAPEAMFHGHPTGGHVSGNVALSSFAVNANSGFEFHWYPFVGGVMCGEVLPGEEVPAPQPPTPQQPAPQPPRPQPAPPQQPAPQPPRPQPAPPQQPAPQPPRPQPAPPQQPAPTPPRPQPPTVICPPCPEYPEIIPCPTPMPCPECPAPMPCPPCPNIPDLIAYPIIIEPVIREEAKCPPCKECEECDVVAGIIEGCIWDCKCCEKHEWEVKLCQCINGKEHLLSSVKVACGELFCFEVPFEGSYLLTICSPRNTHHKCKPALLLKNVGVENLMIDYN